MMVAGRGGSLPQGMPQSGMCMVHAWLSPRPERLPHLPNPALASHRSWAWTACLWAAASSRAATPPSARAPLCRCVACWLPAAAGQGGVGATRSSWLGPSWQAVVGLVRRVGHAVDGHAMPCRGMSPAWLRTPPPSPPPTAQPPTSQPPTSPSRLQAVTHYNDPAILAEVSCDLGEPMVGIDVREKGFKSYAQRSE